MAPRRLPGLLTRMGAEAARRGRLAEIVWRDEAGGAAEATGEEAEEQNGEGGGRRELPEACRAKGTPSASGRRLLER